MPKDPTINVIPSSGHEELFERLATEINSCSQRGLDPFRLVVPSVHFRDWLQVEIARRFGICMGFEFSMPKDFVVDIFRTAGIERAEEWTKRRMEWAIFEESSAKPGLLPAMPPEGSIRDRFAMARAVADRFDQYAHFRPAMLSDWAGGGDWLETKSADEQWQRDLWLALYGSLGSDPGLIPARLETPQAQEKLRAAFPRITVIGSGSLDPLLVEILARLGAAGTVVTVHIALPCLGYLGDLRREALSTQNRHGGDGDPESFDLFADAGQNPLLQSMGRHAAGTFVLLGKLDEQYTNWDDPADSEQPQTLLQHLQAGIRQNVSYEPKGANADASLSVHECYGPRRELEVLRDEILRAYRDIPALKPEELLIATPKLEDYAPLVSAVFYTRENPIPVRLMELPPGEGDEILEGLLALLDMSVGGRGRASEVLDFMQLRAAREALGVGDNEEKLEFLAGKLRDSGITQGFSLCDGQPGGWEFAINRLAAGMFFGPCEPEHSGEGEFQLPVADSMGTNSSELGTFLQWLAGLRSSLIEWQAPATPGQWADRLRHAAAALLTGDEGRMDAADTCLRFLAGVSVTTPVDAAVILDWMESEAAEANRRAPITGATPFGRLKQLHNTPCRVLALVGMQNDNFPSRTKSPSWDLLRAKPKIWDRNARVDERQMFLDSILAPSERLIITASTQNIRTNKKQPLSTCVDELLAAAHKLGVERKKLVLEHPLQPFSEKYFEPESKLGKPFGENIRGIAVAANASCKEPLPFHATASSNEPQPLLEITVAQLAAFWKSPARGYLKAQKIDLPMEEEDDATLDFPPIHLDPLQQWKLKDSILKEQLLAAPDESRVKARAAADRGLPPGFLAESEWRVFQKMEAIANSIKQAKPVDRVLSVEISGCKVTCPVLETNEGVLVGDCGKMDKPKHYLPHWLTALVAAASDVKGGMRIFYEGDPFSELNFAPIDSVDAKSILESVLDGYLQGQQRPLRFAPETSKNLLGVTNDEGFAKAIADWSKPQTNFNPTGGEGITPAAKLVWRDLDPFLDREDWLHWAETISQPLETWKASKK